jgi:hypothetical protein
VNINASRSDLPTPRSQAASRAAQQQKRDWAALAKEKKIKRQKHLEQHNEDYRLRE